MPYILLDCDETIPERMKHAYVSHEDEEIIPACNINTIPGDMNERGCAFAGARGVVGGNVKDIFHIVHGPVGCAYYTWGTRRAMTDNPEHARYCFCTDMQESDIVYGGEKKLEQSCIEAFEEFPHRNGAFIYTTCPTALIGDDVHAVAKNVEKAVNKQIYAVNCPGFAGVSQSKGHHEFNVTFYRWLMAQRDKYPEKHMSDRDKTPYDIALIGDYNMDWDVAMINDMLEKVGVTNVVTFTGNASLNDLHKLMDVKLNVVHCQRSAEYIAEMLKDGFNIPFNRVSFFGISNNNEALRKVAKDLDFPPEMMENMERVIKEEVDAITPELEYYKKHLNGKKCMVYVGGPRTWHWIRAMKDLGIDYVAAACTFSHDDDYEKMNENFIKAGVENVMILDSPNEPELEEIAHEVKPDFMLIGLKERYLFRKYGIPTVHSHSYEEGPYAGYKGFLNFARDIYKAICHPVWNNIREGEEKFKPFVR